VSIDQANNQDKVHPTSVQVPPRHSTAECIIIQDIHDVTYCCLGLSDAWNGEWKLPVPRKNERPCSFTASSIDDSSPG
jgi:hypothetical protein